MGIIKAFTDSVSTTLADQWIDVFTAASFDELTVVSPGVKKTSNNGRGSNYKGSEGIITNGSKIFVPENTAAFIFSQDSIENIITISGAYEYQEGKDSIFNGDGFENSVFEQVKERIKFGGMTSAQKQIAFVNLREIRNIKFGTRGPQVYNDLYYGVDLEIYAYGFFTIKVVNAEKFVREFLPPNVNFYSFGCAQVREQIVAEFLQSFAVALNKLSDKCRISKIHSHENELSQAIIDDSFNAGTWGERFGFEIVKVAIENIEFSDESRRVVNKFAEQKLSISAYEETSQRASNIAAQQKIAEGIQKKGLGDGGGMLFGMNMGQKISNNLGSNAEVKTASLDEQIETMKKLKDLLDLGILTQEEFDAKKKEIMGL